MKYTKKQMSLLYVRILLLIPLVFLWATPSLGEDGNPWVFLPTRLMEIEGGTVSIQSALIVDTRQTQQNPVLQKYPTKYILPLTNESHSRIWVEVEWHIPKKKAFTHFGKLEPGAYGMFYANIKNPVWDTPVRVNAKVFSDEEKTRQIGGREIVLEFEGDEDKDQFMEFRKNVNKMSTRTSHAHGGEVQMPLLPGFQEMDLSDAVPGTMADAKLMEDIQLLLWKIQSKDHWDCTHVVQGAKQYDPNDTQNFEDMSEEGKTLIEEGQERGDVRFEEWQIKSCDSISTYLVLMGKSPTGGTDLMAVNLGEETSEQ